MVSNEIIGLEKSSREGYVRIWEKRIFGKTKQFSTLPKKIKTRFQLSKQSYPVTVSFFDEKGCCFYFEKLWDCNVPEIDVNDLQSPSSMLPIHSIQISYLCDRETKGLESHIKKMVGGENVLYPHLPYYSIDDDKHEIKKDLYYYLPVSVSSEELEFRLAFEEDIDEDTIELSAYDVRYGKYRDIPTEDWTLEHFFNGSVQTIKIKGQDFELLKFKVSFRHSGEKYFGYPISDRGKRLVQERFDVRNGIEYWHYPSSLELSYACLVESVYKIEFYTSDDKKLENSQSRIHRGENPMVALMGSLPSMDAINVAYVVVTYLRENDYRSNVELGGFNA
jgi:hypothetical protein